MILKHMYWLNVVTFTFRSLEIKSPSDISARSYDEQACKLRL